MDFQLHTRKKQNRVLSQASVSKSRRSSPTRTQIANSSICKTRSPSVSSELAKSRKRQHLNQTPKADRAKRMPTYWFESPAHKQQRIKPSRDMRIDVVWDRDEVSNQLKFENAIRLITLDQESTNKSNQTASNCKATGSTHQPTTPSRKMSFNKNNNNNHETTGKFDDMLLQFRDKLQFCKQQQTPTKNSIEWTGSLEDDDFEDEDWLCELPSDNGAVQVEPDGIVIKTSMMRTNADHLLPTDAALNRLPSHQAARTDSNVFTFPKESQPFVSTNSKQIDHIFKVPITPIKNPTSLKPNGTSVLPEAFVNYRTPSKFCSTPLVKSNTANGSSRRFLGSPISKLRTPTKKATPVKCQMSDSVMDDSSDMFDESLDVLLSQLDDQAIASQIISNSSSGVTGSQEEEEDRNSLSFQFDDDDIDFFKLDEVLKGKKACNSVQTSKPVKLNNQQLLQNSFDSVAWDDDFDDLLTQIPG